MLSVEEILFFYQEISHQTLLCECFLFVQRCAIQQSTFIFEVPLKLCWPFKIKYCK